MNPVFVLDLAFVVPLAMVAAIRLLRHQLGGAWQAVALLVFLAILSTSILLMTVSMATDKQPLELPLVAVFLGVIAVSSVLAAFALRTRVPPPRRMSPLGLSLDETSSAGPSSMVPPGSGPSALPAVPLRARLGE